MFKGFQKPKRLVANTESLTDRYGMFTAQPFQRGFGTTIGNSLRRVLLSSIEGAAITAVRIEGVEHEFSPIPGVVEDATAHAPVPNWLEVDREALKGRVIGMPKREELVQIQMNERLIVELYSK